MRRTLLAAVVFALPFAGCAPREVPIAPEPVAAPEHSPAPPAPPPAPAPERPAPVRQGGPEVTLPPPANGVLAPGAADGVMTVGTQPIVRLLEPGAEPRSDLSYALSKGSSQKMAMAMDMTMSVRVKGQPAPQMPMPRMTMTFDTSVTDKSATGDARIGSLLVATSVDPAGAQQEQMANALRPQIDAMKGLGMAYWVDPKGHVHDVKLDVPANVPASAQQILAGMSKSFESMVTPLPQEAVGVGARWQVVSRIASGGADILQSAVYTLKTRNGARATLDVQLVQLAANDTIHSPQMPANMSAKIKAFNSSGTGTTQLDLKSVAPEGGTMSLKTGMDITVQGGGAGPDDGSSVETTTLVQMSRP